jgi:CxxC-x17-CxxC domain-containing protein
MEPRNNDSPQEMVKGKWKCAECGTEITELPFKPAEDRPVHCKECWSKKRSEKGGRDFAPRKMFQGDWKCAECGKAITELPFQPNPDQAVHCRDCWAKKREER